ncbi:hypothetical protein R1sor_005539 [Riccia sorocarpa]|uniref:FAR1-related sequence 11-like HTH-like domain-containing protein n=1 Tax=Riccia sorocarpa TaxID=122646 RepID=A0ABD3HKG3_9MARC
MEAEASENTQSLSGLPVPQHITSLKDLHFTSEQAAFDYYFEYARLHGFVARRGGSKKSQDGVITKRFIPLESQAMIKIFKKAGICVSDMVRFFKAEKDCAPLTFIAKDIYNFLDKDCLQMDSSLLPMRGDAMEVIKTLKDKAAKDPKFFYEFNDCPLPMG